ncbi:hypothetical protein [uncultured Novosphingobium sp.]|uniref:hypothetical protein n=1 Tax=uncultured Novosphingobium sp. TaxID=292277 RepID=UPI0025905E0E|nr:hypothetical protein [uncultured Novosphingobium sp.]
MLLEAARPSAMITGLREQGLRGPWLRLLRVLIDLAGPGMQLLHHSEQAWSSATFHGARHTFNLLCEGIDGVAAGERLIAALPDHEFTLPGRLVADAQIVSVDHGLLPSPSLTMTVALLVLDDD